MKDKLFEDSSITSPGSFVFDQRVAAVFDDMVSRSVPGYQTIQLLVADLACSFAKDGLIYDLGCSTGATIKAIAKRAKNTLRVIGIDNSPDMVERCRNNISSLDAIDSEVILSDLTEANIFSRGKADVIILNLTLQFIRPPLRSAFLQRCFQALNKDGALLLVEKTIEEDPILNTLFIDYYHSFKKEMGYSEMEIAAKREALENVLIPMSRVENEKLLQNAGFSRIGTFFQWFNFAGFLALR